MEAQCRSSPSSATIRRLLPANQVPLTGARPAREITSDKPAKKAKSEHTDKERWSQWSWSRPEDRKSKGKGKYKSKQQHQQQQQSWQQHAAAPTVGEPMVRPRLPRSAEVATRLEQRLLAAAVRTFGRQEGVGTARATCATCWRGWTRRSETHAQQRVAILAGARLHHREPH